MSRRPRPIPKRIRDQVIKLFRSGVNFHDIATQAGIGTASVWRILREAGIFHSSGSDAAERSKGTSASPAFSLGGVGI